MPNSKLNASHTNPKTIYENINEYKLWLYNNASPVLKSLNKGASEDEIIELEKFIGVKLPEDVRIFYKEFNSELLVCYPFFTMEFLSIKRVALDWEVWNDMFVYGGLPDDKSTPDFGVKNDWWNPKWIPLFADGGGNSFCIDLDPDIGGTMGQIITMEHDADERQVLAKSLNELLAKYIKLLNSGKFYYNKDKNCIDFKSENYSQQELFDTFKELGS